MLVRAVLSLLAFPCLLQAEVDVANSALNASTDASKVEAAKGAEISEYDVVPTPAVVPAGKTLEQELEGIQFVEAVSDMEKEVVKGGRRRFLARRRRNKRKGRKRRRRPRGRLFKIRVGRRRRRQVQKRSKKNKKGRGKQNKKGRGKINKKGKKVKRRKGRKGGGKNEGQKKKKDQEVKRRKGRKGGGKKRRSKDRRKRKRKVDKSKILKTVTINTWFLPEKMSWKILKKKGRTTMCKSKPYEKWYSKMTEDVTRCQLMPGVPYVLQCLDKYGSGWAGGSITIQGVTFCKDGFRFRAGHKKERVFVVKKLKK